MYACSAYHTCCNVCGDNSHRCGNFKKVNKIHKDMKIIGEKHGVLKLALHKLHEEKEKK